MIHSQISHIFLPTGAFALQGCPLNVHCVGLSSANERAFTSYICASLLLKQVVHCGHSWEAPLARCSYLSLKVLPHRSLLLSPFLRCTTPDSLCTKLSMSSGTAISAGRNSGFRSSQRVVLSSISYPASEPASDEESVAVLSESPANASVSVEGISYEASDTMSSGLSPFSCLGTTNLPDLVESGANSPLLIAPTTSATDLRAGDMLSREYVSALLAAGSRWCPTMRLTGIGTPYFASQERTVVLQEWLLKRFLLISGSPKTARMKAPTSDAPMLFLVATPLLSNLHNKGWSSSCSVSNCKAMRASNQLSHHGDWLNVSMGATTGNSMRLWVSRLAPLFPKTPSSMYPAGSWGLRSPASTPPRSTVSFIARAMSDTLALPKTMTRIAPRIALSCSESQQQHSLSSLRICSTVRGFACSMMGARRIKSSATPATRSDTNCPSMLRRPNTAPENRTASKNDFPLDPAVFVSFRSLIKYACILTSSSGNGGLPFAMQCSANALMEPNLFPTVLVAFLAMHSTTVSRTRALSSEPLLSSITTSKAENASRFNRTRDTHPLTCVCLCESSCITVDCFVALK